MEKIYNEETVKMINELVENGLKALNEFETFDQEKWNNLQEDTDLFKLSWKTKIKNANTFYKNILLKKYKEGEV